MKLGCSRGLFLMKLEDAPAVFFPTFFNEIGMFPRSFSPPFLIKLDVPGAYLWKKWVLVPGKRKLEFRSS